VEKLFFLSRGIDLTQIGLLLFLWSLMSLIFEVPSGVLADHWSRRKMLILSGVFFSACYITWIFSNYFIMFLFGFLLRTIGATLTSGTLQAYLYDFLKINNKEHNFEKTLGRGNALRTLGLGTAMAFGGFFSEISYTFTLIASAVSILTISVIAFIWPEIKPITSTGEEGYWHFLKNSVKTVGKNKELMRIVLYSAIVLSIFANLEEFNDVYLKFLGYPNYLIGLTFEVLFSNCLTKRRSTPFKYLFNSYRLLFIVKYILSITNFLGRGFPEEIAFIIAARPSSSLSNLLKISK
jgi:MFS family permease